MEKNTVIYYAKNFSEVIRKEIGDEKMAELVSKNAKDGIGAPYCYTHDYLDTNQTMIDLLESHGIAYGSQKFDSLCNDAWNMAKENNFYFNLTTKK